jgi:precorrin-2 dehydrogenase/sirohydrochlorin ferrochelatase
MSYLVNLNIEGRPVLVVGAGAVALRKVEGLLEAGARVTVVAPRICGGVERLASEGRIDLRRRAYAQADCAGAFLVMAATDDESVNAQVAKDAQDIRILVNVADRPALCTATLPAVVRRGSLTLAVATEGKCPAFARALREELEARYGEEYGEALGLMGELRSRMISLGWESPRIQQVLDGIYRDGLPAAVKTGARDEVLALLRRRLGPDFPLEGI